MLKKLISFVVVIAALVALGEWAGKTFFPTPSPEDLQILQDRIDKGAWKTNAGSGQADAAEENAASPFPSLRAVATPASTIPATAVPAASPTPYVEHIVFVAAVPSASPIKKQPSVTSSQTAQATPTASPMLTPTPVATVTPAPTPEAPIFEGMDSAYINAILQGLNERRAAIGLSPLTLNASLSGQAQNHAMNMAKKGGDWFHLYAGRIEDSNYHHISDAPTTIGARASTHAPELCMGERITEDESAIVTAKVISVGIGAVRRGDRVYVCILGEDSVTFQIKATPEPSIPPTSTETEG